MTTRDEWLSELWHTKGTLDACISDLEAVVNSWKQMSDTLQKAKDVLMDEEEQNDDA